MRTIIKLIIIGIITAVAWKFMQERNINVGAELGKAKEWVIEKAKELERLAEESDNHVTDDNKASENSSFNLPLSQTGEEINKPDAQPSADYTAEYLRDAEEYPIEEKYVQGIEKFPELDKYARSVPPETGENMKGLVAWLTMPASDDLGKARLLFTWVASHVRYDDNGYNTGNYSGTSPEEVFRNRIAVCQGYSELMAELCRLAGLQAEVITGYAKGISYRPGDRFSRTNHAWNAIKIDGAWKLFDVTWAAGFGKGVNGKLVTEMRFDDYWFNTRPDEFIFTHLPKEENWQLVDRTISLSQYARMPYASSEYFSIGFNGRQCYQGVLNGTISSFPQTYDNKGDIRLMSMPYSGRLPSGRTIKVKIKSGDAKKIAYSNEGRIIDMERTGDEFSVVINPVPGELRFMARYEEGFGSYDIFLDYVVE